MAEGATGGARIERLKKGDKTRTLLHTDVGNEIIDKLNAFLSMTVVPSGIGEFFYSDGNVCLLLSTEDCGAAAAAGDDTIDGGGA